MTFRLADGLDLPDNAVTQTYAFLGRRGSGKTYGAGKLAELILTAGHQAVIVDPVGTHWGLRLNADGIRPGISIPVFGGQHGDIPLEATAGAVVAKLVAERGTSVVLDVSEFTGADQRRFVADFASELLQLKKRNRSPLMTIWDEAQEFVPQLVRPDHARMVGAMEKLVKLGRNFGIGAALISQRPQAVNKDVLNQTEVLMVFQLTGPQERKVIEGWVNDHGFGQKEVDELPRLPPGTAFVWSPQWLGRFARVKIARKTTFDASATPEEGTVIAAGAGAAVDLAEVRAAMAATIEAAKDTDPKALRVEVARLRAELAGASAGGAAEERDQLRAEIAETRKRSRLPIWLDGAIREAVDLAVDASHALEKAAKRIVDIQKDLEGFERSTDGMESPPNLSRWPDNWGIDREPPPRAPKDFPANPDGHKSFRVTESKATAGLSKCARAVLNVLAQRGHASDSQLSALSGYRSTSSTFANGLSELRVAGYLDGAPERRQVTAAGRKANGPIEPLPKGPALLSYWEHRLEKCERSMLEAVFRAGTISRVELSKRTGYRETSSTFANGISGLRTLDLIHGPNGGDLTIADVFMERA